MTIVLAIDPGTKQSGFVLFGVHDKFIIDKDVKNFKPIIYQKGIAENKDFYNNVIPFMIKNHNIRYLVIEMIECYGMPIGRTTMETILWTGHYMANTFIWNKYLIGRREVKKHLTTSVKARDSQIIGELCNRFAPFDENKGKGTKKNPGYFHGFSKDIWQAFALGITFADHLILDKLNDILYSSKVSSYYRENG